MGKNETHKCLTLLRLKMPRWPLEKEAFDSFFKGHAVKCQYDMEKTAKGIVAALRNYLMDQLEKPVRKEGPPGQSTTSDTIAAMSVGPHCWITEVVIQECVDEEGNAYPCRCELWECDDGSSYWECKKVEIET